MPVTIRGSSALRWYAAVSITLSAAFLVVPWVVPRTAIFLAVTLATIPAVAVGLLRSPRGGRMPWGLLVVAFVAFNAGNFVWSYYVYVGHRATGDGTVADLLFTLANILMLAAALVIVARRGRNDVGGIIDAAVAALAIGGLVWDTVLLPYLTATGAPLPRQVALFGDMFILTGTVGAIVRVWLVAGERIPALRMFVAALGCGLVGHLAAALATDPVTRVRPDWTNFVFLVGYVVTGCAALHPSSSRVTCLGPEPKDQLTTGRLVFLGFALAVIPLVGGGRVILGLPTDGLLIALGSTSVIPMVMVRIARLSSQRSRAERALVHMATHDALTGLPNRGACMNRLAAALSGAPDPGVGAAKAGVAVLFCDLDGFKPVNDQLGHAVGDELLVGVADRLRACLRDDDLVSRFGGDEFVVVCCSDRPQQAAELMCERIRETLLRPFELSGETVRIGISVGAAVAEAGSTVEELINRADTAMYMAKQSKSIGAMSLVVA